MVGQRFKLASAIKGVARMAIRNMLRFAIILYSHNTLLCPPSEQMITV